MKTLYFIFRENDRKIIKKNFEQFHNAKDLIEKLKFGFPLEFFKIGAETITNGKSHLDFNIKQN